MPQSPPSPAGHAPAGLSPFTRDDPRYWDARPADHGLNGLYAEGPQPGVDALLRDALGRVSDAATAHLTAEAQTAEASRELRQALPAPSLPALPPQFARFGRAFRRERVRVTRRAA